MTGMLDEIENLTFTVGETGMVVKGDKKNLRIIITTNTEDSDKIPASFRRRSLYHYIDYPSRSDMAQIVRLNFPNIRKELLDYAIAVFYQYHENPDIQKKPSTPELLAWLRVLMKEYQTDIPQDVPHREVLLKYLEDQQLEIGRLNVEADMAAEKQEGELPNFVYRALKGDKVWHLHDELNEFESQAYYGKFFASLQNKGINFVTPQFEENQGYDDSGYWRTLQKCVRPFHLIVPGIESLGNGYYVIPEDQRSLVEEVIQAQIEVLPAGQEFAQVTEKGKKLTKGTIVIDDKDIPAYIVEDGRVVIEKRYERRSL